jgi:haloacetate dehalogenase
MFDGFDELGLGTGDHRIFCRVGGSGPPVLLLHGFPESHLMWREIAPLLAKRFTVIAMDLPGYGDSGCPPSDSDHSTYSKRAMAAAVAEAMGRLRFDRFAVVGHDRGGRVAYRLALDRPEGVEALVVLDIVPIAEAWDRADAEFALNFWPFSLLAQDPPLPERLISAAPDAVVEDALTNWGSDPRVFGAEVYEKYAAVLRDPAHVHAICEEYRAAASIDRDHDRADRDARRRIECPTLALWSGSGPLGSWYDAEGGPLSIWRRWADRVEGEAVAGGHFFPEEHPQATAGRITGFLEPITSRAAIHHA